MRTFDAVPLDAIETTIALAEVLRDTLPGDPRAHLDEAIERLRQAQASAPADLPSDLDAQLEAALGGTLNARGKNQSVPDLDAAVRHYERAVDLASKDAHSALAARLPDLLMNLGVTLSRRAELTGEGWEQGRARLEDALAAIDPDREPFRWAQAAGNAAVSLRAASHASAADIERAVGLLRRATRLQLDHHAPWAAASNQNNLGNALRQLESGDRAGISTRRSRSTPRPAGPGRGSSTRTSGR